MIFHESGVSELQYDQSGGQGCGELPSWSRL